MIKKIIHTGDIHIRNFYRMDECQEQLSKFIDECKKIASEYGEDEVRIVIAGDIVHNNLDISGEGYIMASWFLRELDKIAKTFVIAGNHDLSMGNLSRLDPLSAIFGMCDFKQVFYLDKETGYQSGCIIDDNVVWCLYSCFDGFARPGIDEIKLSHRDENLTYVGLFHGMLKGSKNDSGYVFENGYAREYFEGVDFALMGHVHKRQNITLDGVPLVYCGSLIQQDHGETLSSHGFLLWDVENATYEEINIDNSNYGFYTFTINSEDDVDNDLENILNL